ncbi:hypothetical protein OSK25_24385, partial [Escherichia coli]|nr:hypothetical protein [Escherichia coli]
VRRHDEVSCDADVSPPKPGRDDRAAGNSATRRLPDRLLAGSQRDERRKTGVGQSLMKPFDGIDD